MVSYLNIRIKTLLISMVVMLVVLFIAVDTIRLRIEVSLSQILRALQHIPAMSYVKMYSHPQSIHWEAIQ